MVDKDITAYIEDGVDLVEIGKASASENGVRALDILDQYKHVPIKDIYFEDDILNSEATEDTTEETTEE